MEEGTKQLIIVAVTTLLIISLAVVGAYKFRELKINNFQNTIKDLSDEQKCMHICSFQYPAGYFDQYKFCLEKCDRISERKANAC